MLQYKIPADVQIEDKIIGPLTLKQLLILAAGGGISYTIFLILSDSYFLGIIDYVFICIPFFLSLAFAFLRINDVSFLKWALLLYEYNHNARRRWWDKSVTTKLHYTFVTAKVGNDQKAKDQEKSAKSEEEQKQAKIQDKTSLEKLTMILDHQSAFSDEEKNLPGDHNDDTGLHLSALEKERHEVRLSHAIAASQLKHA
ncbi:PrgI family protein [Candidatus Peregrinibacteria bacterium]|nr:PrgI family protein [Candidatus Peregrinibacteria bacterium]